MTLEDRLIALAGYDPSAVVESGPVRRRITWLAATTLLPCMLIGASAGFVAWLVEPAMWVASGVGAACALGTLNLLRVSVSGGGIPLRLSADAACRHRPSWLPICVLGLLAGCFAQPALIALRWDAVEPLVSRYRAELVERHLAVSATASGPDEALASVTAYRSALARERFAAQRVLFLWRDPRSTALGTALFLWLCLLPLLLARGPFLAALRAHELVRHTRLRRFVAVEQRATERELATTLAPFTARAPGVVA